MGIELEPGQVAMRCNLVTVADGSMASYSAGNIPSAEVGRTGRRAAGRAWATSVCTFYPGVSFRHILTVRDGAACSPPPSLLLTTSPTARRRLAARRGRGRARAGPHGALQGGAGRPSGERAHAWPAGKPAGHADLAVLAGHAARREMPTFAELYGGAQGRAHLGGRPAQGLALQTGVDFLQHPGRHRRRRQRLRGPDARAPWRPWPTTTWCSCTWRRRTRRRTPATRRARCEAIEQVDALMVPQVLDGALRRDAGRR